MAHGLIAIGFLVSTGDVCWCALTGRRGPLLRPAIAALVAERVATLGAPTAAGLGVLAARSRGGLQEP